MKLFTHLVLELGAPATIQLAKLAEIFRMLGRQDQVRAVLQMVYSMSQSKLSLSFKGLSDFDSSALKRQVRPTMPEPHPSSDTQPFFLRGYSRCSRCYSFFVWSEAF